MVGWCRLLVTSSVLDRGDVKWFGILERWAIRAAVVFWGAVACAIVGRYFWELSHGAIPFQWLVGAR